MLILLNYFVVFPYLLVGSPEPLFYIHNNDLQNHEVTVEVFDSYNESIFKETYELSPEEHILRPKPSWLLLKLYFLPGDKEKYTVKVTSYDNLTETRLVEFQLWNTVHVELYNHEAETPIAINVTTV